MRILIGAMLLAMAGSVQAAVRVVTTLPSLAAIAAEVGGSHVEVVALSTSTEDPHFVDPRPNLLLALNKADLLIANGVELEEGWLERLRLGARNRRILSGAPGYMEAASYIALLEIPTGKIDRSMGDLHLGGNPHFLNEPRRVADIATALGGKLSELDTTHAADYKARSAAFAAALRDLATEQAKRFAALPEARRQVVAYHKSLAYLWSWLGLQEVATLEPKPGVPPDPAHVAGVLRLMRKRQVPAVVQEEYYPAHNSTTLAQLAGARLVVLHGGVRFQAGETYLSYLTQIADDLFRSLSHVE